MVDAHALGACGCGRAGSNPASPTMTCRFANSAIESDFGGVISLFTGILGAVIRSSHRVDDDRGRY